MKKLIIVLSFSLVSLNFHAYGGPAKKTPTKDTGEVDTTHAPQSYKQRLARFHKLIRQEQTRAGKIKKAISLAQNPKSEFRIDAINFLAEIKAQEAVSTLIALARDPQVREFALYALGEAPSEKSIPTLIGSLSDLNENVRGNAERALTKVTRRSFRYQYAAPETERKRQLMEIEEWWKQSKGQFKVKEETPEEKKAAEDAWEKYGRQYIEDLSR